MEYRRLGKAGVFVSEICLGTMQFGWTADENNSRAVMDEFVAAGGNFIDTADIYTNWVGDLSYGGKTEEIMGRWLKDRKNRQNLIIATKVRGRMWDGPNGEGLSRVHIVRACEDSLSRLQTDYIDLYQCHWADMNTHIEETLSALNDLVESGKVRYIGASNYPAWRLMEALAASDKRGWAAFVSYQPQYSLMERSLFEYEAQPLCKHYGLGVIPYSPLASGFLTGKYRSEADLANRARGYRVKDMLNERGFRILRALDAVARETRATPAQISLAWLIARGVTAPIASATSVEQLEELVGATRLTLDAEALAKLDEASAP